MQSTLDILLIIGILINLIKGADLLVPPSAQKKINDTFKNVAKWLDDQGPEKWIMYLLSSLRSDVILIGYGVYSLFLSVALCLIFLQVLPLISQSSLAMEFHQLYFFEFYMVFAGSSLLVIQFLHFTFLPIWNIRLGQQLDTKWFSHAIKSKMREVRRPYLKAFFPFAGYLIFCYLFIFIRLRYLPLQSLAYLLIGANGKSWVWGTIWGNIFTLGPFLVLGLTFVVFFILGNFVLLFPTWISVILLRTLLKVARFLVERIKEYNKGALAAILLIVTILLGIIDLFLKLKL